MKPASTVTPAGGRLTSGHLRRLTPTLLLISAPLAFFGGCSSEPPISTDDPNATSTTSGNTASMTANATNSSNTSTGTASMTSAATSSATASSSTMTSSTSTTGTGGAGGTGTSSDTSSTNGGSGGTSTSTSTTGEMPLTVGAFVGELDGMLIQTPCSDEPNTDDCNGSWINPGETNVNLCQGASPLNFERTFPLAGTPGMAYDLKLHFYGIMEPKNYGDNQRREAGQQSPQNLDTGATPEPWYVGEPNQDYIGSDYNTYEVHVLDESMQEIGVYFINSDTSEGHWTFVIDYERTIPVVGGGAIHVRVFDRNCRQIKNCTNSGTPCANKARTVDISAADPQPTNFDQPSLGVGNSEHSGQWWLIDAVSVEPSQG